MFSCDSESTTMLLLLLGLLLVLLVALILVKGLLTVYKCRRNSERPPPHVHGFPFVGYLPFLGREAYKTFHRLMEDHGPIFSVYLGSLYTVILGNYASVQEAFVTKGSNFSGRPPCLPFNVFECEKSFVFLRGEEWKLMRNFTMNAIRGFAFSQTYIRSFVQVEIKDLVVHLRRFREEPVHVERLIQQSMSSLILSLLTGKRYGRHDPWKSQVVGTASALVASYGTATYVSFYPWLKRLSYANKLFVSEKTKMLKERLWALLEEEIDALRVSFLPNAEPHNFIHLWFMEHEKRILANDPYQELFSDLNLKDTMDFLIQASAETTPVLFMWIMLYLLIYPSMQERIHREIDRFIGHERNPTVDDLRNMHFTKAFVTEVHRRTALEPLGIYRRVKKTDTLQGYAIPKDSVVISNLWSVHHDPQYFPEPYKFNPKRFLDKFGKFKPSEYFSSFSFGLRMCPGKSVAEIQIYLYVMFLLQAFELYAAPGAIPSEQDYTIESIVRRPKPFPVAFKQRHKTG